MHPLTKNAKIGQKINFPKNDVDRYCCWRATSPLATCNIDCSPPSHATGCQQNATHATALNEKRGVSVLMAHLGLELSSTDINSTFRDSE